MRSPVSPETELEIFEVEKGLQAYRCPRSRGIWIPRENYWQWREHLQASGQAAEVGRLAAAQRGEVSTPEIRPDGARPALICPESGRLLIRYRVGHGLNFRIDVSPVTGGVWLDEGEWEALKARGLHRELHLIFTASYQRQVRTAEYDDSLDRALQDRIGAVDFARLAEMTAWLRSHPQRREMLGYLLHHVTDHAS